MTRPLAALPTWDETVMTNDNLLWEDTAPGVVTLTLNRPDKKNALDRDLLVALIGACERLTQTPGVRVTVLRGAGSLFSSGVDIQWMADSVELSDGANYRDAALLGHALKAIYDLPTITVAVVHGGAYGAGVGLALACDFAITTADAKFSLAAARLGLNAGEVTPFMVNALGARATRNLLLTGRSMDAFEAEKLGVITEIAADRPALEVLAARMLKELRACAPGAVAAIKTQVAEVTNRELDAEVLRVASKRLADARRAPEAQAGLNAFLGRRAPPWAS